MCNIEKLFKDVNKKSPDNNIWYSAINIANIFLAKHFIGTEHDLVKKEYSTYLFIWLLEYLSDSRNLNPQNFKSNILEEFMDEIRTETYKWRKKVFYIWLNSIIENRQNENHLIQSLITFYPSVKHIKQVKEQLGLNYKVKVEEDELAQL